MDIGHLSSLGEARQTVPLTAYFLRLQRSGCICVQMRCLVMLDIFKPVRDPTAEL